jgi:hypothetical protein
MAITSRWQSVANSIYWWERTIERILSAEPLPRLSGPVSYIFSDYGGAHRQSGYETTGILYMDLYGSRLWELRRRDLRRRYLPDGRRMAFKSLGDRYRKAVLIPFLEAADEIEGLCLVVAVSKSITDLYVNPSITAWMAESLRLRRRWRSSSFESLVRMAHLIGLLIGGLSQPGQNIYWVSDEDALFANEATALDLKDILARFSSNYVRHPLGELGLGTVSIDPGDRFEEDHVAITDLASGALAEVLTTVSTVSGGHIPPQIAIPFSGRFQPKTELIYSWFSGSASPLRKVCIVFERLRDGKLAVFRFDCQE